MSDRVSPIGGTTEFDDVKGETKFGLVIDGDDSEGFTLIFDIPGGTVFTECANCSQKFSAPVISFTEGAEPYCTEMACID